MKSLRIIFLFLLTTAISLSYTLYLFFSRESYLWWSKITDIEKLISFRTEQGLYYSYFQEFIDQDSVINGLFVLFDNNMTEFPQRINIIKRMNVFQEIFLGIIYKGLSYININISPIEFYVNSVLLLQGLLIASIFLISFSINNSLLAGLLTVVFFALNRGMVSRVSYSLPLRESFALPFWWLHVLTLHLMMRPQRPNESVQTIIRVLFYASTFLFCLLWQFSQFVILLECCVIFMLDSLEFISHSLTRRYYITCLAGILATAILQMGNVVLLSSLPMALIISSLLLDCIKTPALMESSFSGRITWISIQATGRVVAAILIRVLLNTIFRQKDDSHIFDFLAAKFGIGRSRDFHVNLYLCHEGFKWLSMDKFAMEMKMVTYPYLLVYFTLGIVIIVSSIAVLWHDTEEEEELHPSINESIVGAEGDFCGGCGHLLSSQPELAYHFGINTMSLLLTLIVQRMQFFLVPYMLIFASMAYGHTCFYCYIIESFSNIIGFFVDTISSSSENYDVHVKALASRRYNLINKVMQYSRQAVIMGIMCAAIVEVIYSIRSELSDLREFYDPDTVELMQWIRKSTYRNDSFSGSMQLMAAVKLITQRPIVNHPHFEDADLRSKTKKLYQVYARRSPQYIHQTMEYHQVRYIILEDSICLAKSNGCQLNDLLDLDNGQRSDSDLNDSNVPRFCDAIREFKSSVNDPFKKYFKERFVNPTFRVYQVV